MEEKKIQKKRRLISFNWNKYFIYAIIYWIIQISIRTIIFTTEIFTFSDNIVHNEYIIIVLFCIGNLFSFVLVLYTKYSMKSENEIIPVKEDKRADIIFQDPELRYKTNYMRHLLIITLIEYLSYSLYWIAYIIVKVTKRDKIYRQFLTDSCNAFDILTRYSFSIFILKNKLYKHKIFSMILILFGFAILLPVDGFFMQRKEGIEIYSTLYHTGILLIIGISFPLKDLLIKKLFEKKYLMPQNLMFYKSLIEVLIISVLTAILMSSLDIGFDTVKHESENIIAIIIYCFLTFIKNYFLLKIIYHFSSESVSFLVVSKSIAGSVDEVHDFFTDGKSEEPIEIILFIAEILGIIIIAFATLVYDEIIIIHKCDLDKNTKKAIIIREEEDKLNCHLTLDEEIYLPEDNNEENENEEVGIELD